MPPIDAPARQRFDALFREARRYRGDCRLVRTAIRRGWMDDLPQSDRDALVRRLIEAQSERADFDRLNPSRAALGEARVLLEMHSRNVDSLARLVRLASATRPKRSRR